MDSMIFIDKFQEAFGNAELPIAFWYSNEAKEEAQKSKGCFLPNLKEVRKGKVLTFSKKNISCPGGKVFSGFNKPFLGMTKFVSTMEGYKNSPKMVDPFLPKENQPGYKYLNFARVDKVETLDFIEGVIFYANPDILSGLTTWAFFDNNEDDAVSTIFGSGCSSIITKVYEENKQGGNRTFLGMFDPSARIGIEPDLLTFAIPMSRFKKMITTIDNCFLTKNSSWKVVRQRDIE